MPVIKNGLKPQGRNLKVDTFRDDMTDIYQVHNIDNKMPVGNGQLYGIINYDANNAKSPSQPPTSSFIPERRRRIEDFDLDSIAHELNI